MKLRITHLKAPWPANARPGDVVDLPVEEIPGWALGKCVPVGDDEAVTIDATGRAPEKTAEEIEAEAEALRVAEAEAAAARVTALRAEAEALGVKVDSRWGEKRLAEEIAKAKTAGG